MTTFIAEDCEKAILGKMLADPRSIDEALCLVHRNDFATDQRSLIFDAITHTHSHGGCDVFSVLEALKGSPRAADTR